jgi:hypothetical protein
MLPANKLSNLRRRANRARKFPSNTCGASRHVHELAEALVTNQRWYGMLCDEREEFAVSMLAILESLWKLRTRLAKMEKR